MAPYKIDLGIILLVSITILQVTYTTWSVFGGQWSAANHYKSSHSIPQRPVKGTIKVATNSTNLVFKHGRKLPITRHKDKRGYDDGNNDSDNTKGILNVIKSDPDGRNAFLSRPKSLSDDIKTPKRDSTLLSNSSRSLSSERHSDSRSSQFILDKPNVCDGSPLVVIIVCSASEHLAMRDVIRQTWASQRDPDVRTLFLLGRNGNDSVDSSVSSEDEKHGDVIRMDFVDSYANLSLKSTLMLGWMLSHCSTVKFLVKTDDDTFLNAPLLLKDLRKTVHSRFIMGNVIALAQPVRTPNAKWFTSLATFNRSAYPTYVSGAAYVISVDAIEQLYSASRKVPLFWLEDVYVTGLLAGSAKIPLIFNGKFDGFKDFPSVCSLRYHTVRHRISTDQMHVLWSAVRSNFTREQCTQ